MYGSNLMCVKSLNLYLLNLHIGGLLGELGGEVDEEGSFDEPWFKVWWN